MDQAIKDKAPKPAGLVPKNLQALIIVGLALLMVTIMAVTGHKRPAPPSTAAAPSLPNLIPVNSQKVTDFQKNIEQTQRESAPQVEAALLQQQRQLASQAARPAQPFPSSPYGTPVTASDPSGAYPPGAYAATLPQTAENQAPSDLIRDEQKKRAYVSLFSDNVALTYRKELRNEARSAVSSPAINGQAPRVAASPEAFGMQDPLATQASAEFARESQLLAQAQQAALMSQSPVPSGTQASSKATVPRAILDQNQSESSKSNPPVEAERSALPASHDGKDYVLFEGTVLEALLINRLDGTFAGPVSCLLSSNVYSHDRKHLLIPAGSKILGEASKVDTLGQARLAVAFHRLIMPDGYAVNLDQFKGLDQQGATALSDKVNNHYAKIFGASVAIGVLGGVAQLGTGSVLNADSSDRIREGFGVGMANAGEHILDRFLNILPTVTIREGTRIKIFLSNDLLLPDYNTHTMPSNL
ncbi:MAG: putative conjugal transfer protein TrbI family [Candidatus Sulfotelmatobacter sp.]|nr:putative conjugal transfer protein TrbI family [Candidatus Sulfotelmatobacter sp.]